MQTHVLVRDDGTIAVMTITAEGLLAGATVESELAKWHPDERARIVEHKEIDPADIPRDRKTRAGWNRATFAKVFGGNGAVDTVAVQGNETPLT